MWKPHSFFFNITKTKTLLTYIKVKCDNLNVVFFISIGEDFFN